MPTKGIRIVLSIVIAIHLWGVIAEPLRFSARGPGGTSPAAESIARPIQPYTQALYLNHGYAFFAPDPGPSHLLQMRWIDGQGNRGERRIPDLQTQWPRLMYHRHFMLSEFYSNAYRPPNAPFAIPLEEQAAYRQERAIYEQLGDSIRRHMQAQQGTMSIGLERIEHRMPGLPEVVNERRSLTDPSLYRTMSETE
jgi:hypothetical protein